MKMGRSRASLKRALFISGFAAVAMFSSTAMAATSSADVDKTTTTPTTTQKTTAAAATTATTGRTTGVITATGTAETESQGTLPAVTSSSSGLALPTLSTTNTAVPTYPAPSVPPTADAPFMRHSNVPQGTVFIAVGAILGAFAIAILIWRAAVAYILHRSIERAALAQHLGNDKAPFASASTVPLFTYSDPGSTLHLGGAPGAPGAGLGVRRTNRGPTPSTTPSQTNLFFSPTASGAAGGGLSSSNNNRESRLLPSGFYAAGAGAPAAAMHGATSSTTNLSPDYGQTRSIGTSSPPDSPSVGPLRNSVAYRNISSSSVNLNRPLSARAPSAFLDDLLDDQPHLFPPGASSPHDPSHGQASQGAGRF